MNIVQEAQKVLSLQKWRLGDFNITSGTLSVSPMFSIPKLHYGECISRGTGMWSLLLTVCITRVTTQYV